eukprot:CAMPEP_0171311238 /NCGR_PEP_ID=MMETSP0816-20121228/21478_1 /TAXON_ID=420281 /ORGANISM="Proboscia inermis, Strain CCAP1064/1" /LENGTH=40 /DNA_ID= /DNA_START= /DNA_END= /DNA_ORIENTATION=
MEVSLLEKENNEKLTSFAIQDQEDKDGSFYGDGDVHGISA